MMQDLRAFSLVHNDFTLTIAMWYAFDLFNSYETRLDRVLIIKLERRHEEQRPERLYKCLEIRLETMAEYESRMGSITAMVKRADDRHRGLGNSGAATVALSEDRLVGDTTLVSRRQCRFTHSLITVWETDWSYFNRLAAYFRPRETHLGQLEGETNAVLQVLMCPNDGVRTTG